MTEEQIQEVLDFAKARIASWMEKIQLKLGRGIKQYQQMNTQVLSLESKPRVPQRQVMEDYWSVEFVGNFVTLSESRFDFPPPVGTQSYSNTIVSTYGRLLFVDMLSPVPNTTNSLIVNKVASSVILEPPVTGFTYTEQTMFISIPEYQFPVRLTIEVREFDTDNNLVNTTFDNLTFNSDAQQSYLMKVNTPSTKLYTAVAVTRL